MSSRPLDFIDNLRKNIEKLSSFLEELKTDVFAGKRIQRIINFHKIVVVGDIHGDLNSLLKSVKIAHDEGYPDKALLIFLGDYIDRGPMQLESLLYASLLAYENSESTILLRGNHEPHPSLIPYPHDFPSVLSTLYKEWASTVYLRFLEFFEALPLVAVDFDNGLLFMHGGVPVKSYERGGAATLEEYLGGESSDWRDEYTEILWNDPGEHVSSFEPSPRGVGYIWGREVTNYVKSKYGISTIIRGHEPANAGYKLNHGGTVVTIFSRLGFPYYNERACLAVLNLSLQNERLRLECWP